MPNTPSGGANRRKDIQASMYSAAEIETIVQVVVERLRATSTLGQSDVDAPPAPMSSASVSTAKQSQAKQIDRGRLVLSQRVITLESLVGRLQGVTSLQVQKQAVVTPAVIDELKERRIQLLRYAESVRPADLVASNGVLVVAPVRRRASFGDQFEFTAGSANCSADVRRIAAHMNSGGLRALWVTETPFAAAEVAGKYAVLRSVNLDRLRDLSKAVREVEPNVLILDQEHWNEVELLDLLTAWTGGAS